MPRKKKILKMINGRTTTMIVIGNGFTLSFLQRRPSLWQSWHSSRPLSFDVRTPRSAVPFLDNLPYFKSAVEAQLAAEPGGSDFEVMRAVLDHSRKLWDPRRVATTKEQSQQQSVGLYIDAEARHFFALAYSYLQLQMDAALRGPWEWPEWIAKFLLPRDFIYVVSFNYDLLIETLLQSLRFPIIRQHGVREDGVVVFKPHGSIDYEMTGIDVPRGYPLSLYATWNDMPVEVIPRSDLLRERIHPVAVLPTETTMFARAQFNRRGYPEAGAIAKKADRLIIIGFSYSDADRHEFDFLLDNLARSAQIYLVDPYPSGALIQAINDRGYRLCVSGSPPDLSPRGL